MDDPLVAVFVPPTTVQLAADLHDTPDRVVPVEPAGSGTDRAVQLVPFQDSATATVSGGPVDTQPAAMHLVAVGQETPVSMLPDVPGADAWIVQLVPSQRSISGWNPEPVLTDPMAVQALADEHDTADRDVNSAPAGLGVDWIVQLVPFQDSASGAVVPGPVPGVWPTAMQELADLHDTAVKKLSTAEPDGSIAVQPAPSQLSASGRIVPSEEVLATLPTAMQALADVQDTPLRAPPRPPGSGVGWIVQAELPDFCSASGTLVLLRPIFIAEAPTAVHTVADGHDAPPRSVAAVPGRGAFWITHPVLAPAGAATMTPAHASAAASAATRRARRPFPSFTEPPVW